MYKIIACDLDETLLSDDRTISKENIEAIQKAKELGVKFVPATGRGFNTVGGTLKDLGLYDLENEYVISYNGGAITENKGSKLLHFEGISFEKASELYKRGLDYDVCIHVYTKDMVYAYKYVQEEKDYLAGRMEVTEIFDDNIDFSKGFPKVKSTSHIVEKDIEEDFKKMIVELYENKKPICEIKREYGLCEATLYRWIKEYGKIKITYFQLLNDSAGLYFGYLF